MGVYKKLMHVQSGINAPKNQYNKFGNYYYRNCEDIQEAAKPLMKEVQAALIVGDELVQVDSRFYIKATARFIDCETGEETCNTAYAREELDKKGMDASQVTGSTSSYARKYALNGLFCIDDVKDPDSQDNSGKDKKPAGSAKGGKEPAGNTGAGKKTPDRSAADPGSGGKTAGRPTEGPDIDSEKLLAEKIDQPKLNVIRAELERTGLDADVIFQAFNLKQLEDITNSQFVAIMKKFKATPSKEA